MADATILIEVLEPGERADRLLEQVRTRYSVTPAQVGLPMERSSSSARLLYKGTIRDYRADTATSSLTGFLNGIDPAWRDVLHVTFQLS